MAIILDSSLKYEFEKKKKIPLFWGIRTQFKSDIEEKEPGLYSSPSSIISFAEAVLQNF